MKKKINGIVGGISEQGIHIVCTEASINQIDENLKESVLLEYPLPLQIQSKLLSFSFDGNFISLVDDNKALVFDLQTKKISAEFLPAVISSSPCFPFLPFLSLSPPLSFPSLPSPSFSFLPLPPSFSSLPFPSLPSPSLPPFPFPSPSPSLLSFCYESTFVSFSL